MNPASNVIGSKHGIGWSPLEGLNVKGVPLALGGLTGMLGAGGGLSGLFGGGGSGQQSQPQKTPYSPLTSTEDQITSGQIASLPQMLSGGAAPGAGAFGSQALGTGAGGAAGNALASTGTGAATGAAAGLASAMPYVALYEALKGSKPQQRTQSGAGYGVG